MYVHGLGDAQERAALEYERDYGWINILVNAQNAVKKANRQLTTNTMNVTVMMMNLI